MSDAFINDELFPVTDILRSMLDKSEADNRRLLERIEELEAILKEHDIPIPDHDVWHSELPVA